MDNFLEFLGRLHPLVVHFPIALIMSAAGIELLRSRRETPSEAGVVFLGLGSVAAILAVGTGWLHAERVDVGTAMEIVLFRHRWVGVGVAGVSLITALLTWRMRVAPSAPLGVAMRTGWIASLLLVGYGGHLGGTLVFGEGYLLEALTSDQSESEELRSPEPDPPSETLDPPISNPDDPPPDPSPGTAEDTPPLETGSARTVSFEADVLPIFESRCYKCHGPRGKARGGLRLSDVGALLERPEELSVLHPGSAEESLLYQLIRLPADDLDIMPASGDPLTPEEIGVIKRWIDEGAHAEAAGTRTVSTPGQEGQTFSSIQDEEVVLDEAQRAIRDKALDELRTFGAHAVRVAQTSDEVEVHLGLMGQVVEDGTLQLLRGLEPCLVTLDLSRTAVSDEGLAALAAFPQLRRLRLDRTSVGDAGLVHLGGMERMESLNLFQTKVGDRGLEVLRTLKRLRKLYVWQSEVSVEGIAELQNALPDLTIVGGEGLADR
ncbi:MAG: hypothetical protein CMJ89_10290 [Planctomycetes bacterium]|nr:hypothetical protein [Planctomycetota bacterium]